MIHYSIAVKVVVTSPDEEPPSDTAMRSLFEGLKEQVSEAILERLPEVEVIPLQGAELHVWVE